LNFIEIKSCINYLNLGKLEKKISQIRV